MRSLLKKRLEVYRSEEKTLIVMLEEEKEQLQKEDDSKRKKLMEKGDYFVDLSYFITVILNERHNRVREDEKRRGI